MLLPIILLTSVSQFFQVVLNSLSKYIAQSIGKIVTSFISVVLLLLLMDFCGLRAVVLGLEFGLVVLILLQYIIITKSRISYFPRAGFILDNSFYRNTIWLSLTYLITAIQLVYEKFVFLSFGNGVLSSYNYSQALFQIPQMIIVSGVLAIVSTNFMKNILDDEINSGLDNLYKIAFNSFIISAFVAVSISIFSEEIVFILFFRGKFNYNSFIQTVSILRILIFAFPLLVIGSVLGRALVALKKFNQLTIINLFNSIFLIISLYISYLFQNLIFCVSTIIFIHFVIVCYKLKIYESLYISEINSRKKGTVNIMIGFLLIVLFAAFLLWIKSYFINIFSISQISLILESISALTILVVFVFFYFKLIESNEKN
jgi:putative peptidoglycan lipid II flippase